MYGKCSGCLVEAKLFAVDGTDREICGECVAELTTIAECRRLSAAAHEIAHGYPVVGPTCPRCVADEAELASRIVDPLA